MSWAQIVRMMLKRYCLLSLVAAAIAAPISVAQAQGDSRKNMLSVTASVGRSCSISTSSAAQHRISCAPGTSWTASVTQEERVEAPLPVAVREAQQVLESGAQRLTVLTLTY